ncbi:MAG TPA: enoyl-CoA hydratase/isomerase family protein [Castellaniella sp.]|uniref:enoyl-CoA hydratase/isomerase family protein n=1 Tax=Castellaniella sp. TaxID=1955812 RepID=UPI002F1EC0DD
MSDEVIFDEIPARGGRRVALATLNSPQTLNGLSLPMCRLLAPKLRQWADDGTVAAVFLRGAGEKAFCAGGDLHALYHSMQTAPVGDAWANVLAREFFEAEYRLDFSIHTYPKPLLCWGSGIVMGGGVGLLLGASHRIVTETTRFAMPEVTIGLYPDVAGTWMLSRMPAGIGAFLAFTGSQLGAADCLHFGLADWQCSASTQEEFLAALTGLEWADDADRRRVQIDALLQSRSEAGTQIGPLQRHSGAIRAACQGSDFVQIGEAIGRWKNHDDPWLARAAATFLAGSPGSARLSHTLLSLGRHASLADAFRTEYVASLHCCAEPDFREGIRALLIDKDRTPRWQPSSMQDASSQWVRRFLVPPWPAEVSHPLADLGR